MRKIFSKIEIKDYKEERPVISHDMRSKLYIFGGTKITSALRYLMSQVGLSAIVSDNGCALEIAISERVSLLNNWDSMLSIKSNLDSMLFNALEESPQLINISKWGKYLPQKYQVSIIKKKLYDFNGAFDFIENVRLSFQKEHL